MVSMGLTGCHGYAASSRILVSGNYARAIPVGRSSKLGQGKSAALRGNLGIDSPASLAPISASLQWRGPAIGSCTGVGRLWNWIYHIDLRSQRQVASNYLSFST